MKAFTRAPTSTPLNLQSSHLDFAVDPDRAKDVYNERSFRTAKQRRFPAPSQPRALGKEGGEA